jgi:hypothetical protein
MEQSPDTEEPRLSSKYKRRAEYRTNDELREYKNKMRSVLMTTRFNNKTWDENQEYIKGTKFGCIYPSPLMNNSNLEKDTVLFILEMNNDENRIMGIGLVRNTAIPKKYHIYENENYNRYAYVGKHRIDRTEMGEEEEQIMKVFDNLCFTGANHMKRLQGMKAFPVDMLYRCSKILDLMDFISTMFKSRFFTSLNIYSRTTVAD